MAQLLNDEPTRKLLDDFAIMHNDISRAVETHAAGARQPERPPTS